MMIFFFNFLQFSNDVHYCVEKVEEGAVYVPACSSSFDAELKAVHELIQHVDHLVTRKIVVERAGPWRFDE